MKNLVERGNWFANFMTKFSDKELKTKPIKVVNYNDK